MDEGGTAFVNGAPAETTVTSDSSYEVSIAGFPASVSVNLGAPPLLRDGKPGRRLRLRGGREHQLRPQRGHRAHVGRLQGGHHRQRGGRG